jgi:membrane fusion protein, multidrug efflux system
VQRGPDGTFVYVVQSDQTVQPHPIQIELTQGTEVLIARGVSAGDQVVVEGQSQLKPGSKVAPKQPAAAPAGARPEVRGREPQPPRGREASR